MNFRTIQKMSMYVLAMLLCCASMPEARAMDDSKKQMAKIGLLTGIVVGGIGYAALFEHKTRTNPSLTLSQSIKDDAQLVNNKVLVPAYKGVSYGFGSMYKGGAYIVKKGGEVCTIYPVGPYMMLGLAFAVAANQGNVKYLMDATEKCYDERGAQETAKAGAGIFGELLTNHWGKIATFFGVPAVLHHGNNSIIGLLGWKNRSNIAPNSLYEEKKLSDKDVCVDLIPKKFRNKLELYKQRDALIKEGKMSGKAKYPLLLGAPGIGKTEAVQWYASKTGAKFILINMGVFSNRWKDGATEATAVLLKHIGDMVRNSSQDIIVFGDEIDRLAKTRDGKTQVAEQDNPVTALMEGLDRLKTSNKLTIFFASNLEEDKLDKAFVSRCETYNVPSPDKNDLKTFFSYYVGKFNYDDAKTLGADKDLSGLDDILEGMSYRDITKIVDGALEDAALHKKNNLKPYFEALVNAAKKQEVVNIPTNKNPVKASKEEVGNTGIKLEELLKNGSKNEAVNVNSSKNSSQRVDDVRLAESIKRRTARENKKRLARLGIDIDMPKYKPRAEKI